MSKAKTKESSIEDLERKRLKLEISRQKLELIQAQRPFYKDPLYLSIIVTLVIGLVSNSVLLQNRIDETLKENRAQSTYYYSTLNEIFRPVVDTIETFKANISQRVKTDPINTISNYDKLMFLSLNTLRPYLNSDSIKSFSEIHNQYLLEITKFRDSNSITNNNRKDVEMLVNKVLRLDNNIYNYLINEQQQIVSKIKPVE